MNGGTTSSLTHGTRAPARGRARYRVPGLRRNARLAREIEEALAALPHVCHVHASPRTGRVLVVTSPRAQVAPRDVARRLGRRLEAPPASVSRKLARGALRTALRAVVKAQRRLALSAPVRLLEQARGRGERPTRALASPDDVGPPWHLLSEDEVGLATRGDAVRGLSPRDAAERLLRVGPNALAPPPQRSDLQMLWEQFANTPILMLGASTVLSLLTGGVGEAVAIASVLGINVMLGFTTERGAERTIQALTQTPQPHVPVVRGGKLRDVAVSDVVPGDLLLLHGGTFVAADARVVSAQDLTVDESALTGESMPVAKHPGALDEANLPLGDRTNMVYRGTLVTGGSGSALVVATGDATQLGHIQSLTFDVKPRETPMQQQLDRLGKQLALGAGLACAATLGVGVLRGQSLLSMFRTAVSLGVAAVPEGLPTVAMTTLALGLKRMRRERVIVRRLSAVETLGAVQVVCLDKTGTLTRNQMRAVAVQAGLRSYQVQGGRFVRGHTESEANEDLRWLLRLGALCSEAELAADGRSLTGSPTEVALIQLALDAGIDVRALRAEYPLLATQRRAQARAYMSTRHRHANGELLALKGRPSEVLALCSHHLYNGEVRPLTEREYARIETENERMAGRALRVLGFAYGHGRDALQEAESRLVWVGLVAMEDPPRDGVASVMQRFHAAGVRTVMITGDQSSTAQAIGRQVELSNNGGHLEIIDSTRLDRIDAELLGALAQRADVFARVSPAHKLQIVKALQKAGHVVAMTGDGVNDGPALKASDIGIAMGVSGSSAAREVADVVLEDDELRSLMVAIEQGRTIYADIQKAVHFVLATNLSEIVYTFACVATGMGEPLTPLQLLWINLLTDVAPELALAVQPPEPGVLTRPPRDPNTPMFTTAHLRRIGVEGLVITAGALSAQRWARRHGAAHASSVGFTALTLAQLLHALSARSQTHTIFDATRLERNRWLPLTVFGTAGLQVLAGLTPGLRSMLSTVRLSGSEWLVTLLAAVLPLLVNESTKLLHRSRDENENLTPALPTLGAKELLSAE